MANCTSFLPLYQFSAESGAGSTVNECQLVAVFFGGAAAPIGTTSSTLGCASFIQMSGITLADCSID